jgi:peptidoglycan L-alanyl-D-glutamate endopeptidase CwlK
MASFGYGSLKQLDTIHPDLRKVLEEAIKTFDFTVICGHRGEAEQNRAVAEGKSQLKWPNSKHNSYPSRAADCAPYPIDWSEKEKARFLVMAGHIEAAAIRLGIKVRFGWDFNQNHLNDDNFKDLPHVELA